MRKGGMEDPVIQRFVIGQQKQSLAVEIQTPQGVNIGRDLKKIFQAGLPALRAEPGNYLKRFVYDEISEQVNSMKLLRAKGFKRS
jgi:hypothetical protein